MYCWERGGYKISGQDVGEQMSLRHQENKTGEVQFSDILAQVA